MKRRSGPQTKHLWDGDPAKPLLNPREEGFCLEYVKAFPNVVQGECAAKAGYSERSAAQAASKLVREERVQMRIQWLLKAGPEAEAIMTVEERKRRLSEIARDDIEDHVDERGTRLKEARKNRRPGVASISVMEQEGEKGSMRSLSVSMHSPVAAIKELNTMDGVYPDKKIKLNAGDADMTLEIVATGPGGKPLRGDK